MGLARTKIILDTRGKERLQYQVKIRITYRRQANYIGTGVYLSPEEFENVFKSRSKKEEQYKIKLKLEKAKAKIDDAIEQLSYYTFDALKDKLQLKSNVKDVFEIFDEYNKSFINENHRTYTSYRSGLISLKKFFKLKYPRLKYLPVDRLTVDFLKSYEVYMTDNGKSLSTVGCHLRPLRAAIIKKIDSKELKEEQNPFGRGKYVIPRSSRAKRALTESDIKLIKEFRCESHYMEKSRDLWMFSYYTGGMNMKDIAHLKRSDIHMGHLRYTRQKTKNTTRNNLKQVSLKIVDQAKEIIMKWGNVGSRQDDYLFPILRKGLSEEEANSKINSELSTLNINIKKIARIIGVTDKVSFYWARHSFATAMARKGAPLILISDYLSHTSVKTTEIYLSSFDDDVKHQYLEQIADL